MKSNLPVANVLSTAYKERSIEEVKNKVWNHIGNSVYVCYVNIIIGWIITK